MEEPTRNFKVVVISRQTIKPRPPSPPDHLRTFKLSLLDQLTPPIYARVILFYKGTRPLPHSPCGGGGIDTMDEKSKKLKSSLSETLTRFYPVAGRLKDNLSFNCNDEGVEYLEAQVARNWPLSDVLAKSNSDHLSLLLPVVEEESSLDISTRPMCLVQVSFFGCGGMAIGIKICHKIADAATLCSFVVGWANTTTQGGGNPYPVIPDFCGSDIFPPIDSFPNSTSQALDEKWNDNVRSRRFHFGKSELVALQAKAASTNVPRPTRFEAVTALLWKVSLLARKEPKPSVLICPVNLRPRLEPPLSEHSFGNLCCGAFIQLDKEENLKKVLPRMVDDLRREMVKIKTEGFQKRGPNMENGISKVRDGAIELYVISGWCNLPFYQVDFGWGKPAWATSIGPPPPGHNIMLLMDTSDGEGIEAWVYLKEGKMNLFESNQELIKYTTSFNPSSKL